MLSRMSQSFRATADGIRRSVTSASGNTGTEEEGTATYRVRFFNFNMANNSTFEKGGLSELQGPGGRGKFEDVFIQPLADGHPPDLVFSTLVETRLAVTAWMEEHLAKKKSGRNLDRAISHNACRAAGDGWIAGLAANYNGNLKSIMAFSSKAFAEQEKVELFGKLHEKMAGLYMPNPKKAFIGRTVVERRDKGVRFCFVAAHFPVLKLAQALEDPSDPWPQRREKAKLALAKTLRKILKKATDQGIIDDNTVIVVQGDLNSRTLLGASGGHDVLLDLLHDEELQVATRHELPIPVGHWRELVEVENNEVGRLPITYKYKDQCGSAFTKAKGASPSFTIGDVLQAAAADVGKSASSGVELYLRTLQSIDQGKLASWGVEFQEDAFRPFRFPCCADRILYWAPDTLAARISWETLRGGYEVNHFQSGSDHRPVSVECILRVEKSAAKRVIPASSISMSRWDLDDSFAVCEEGEEREFEGKAHFLDKRNVQSVRTAVTMLNNGSLSCSEEFCVAFDAHHQKWFALYHRGRREAAIQGLGLSEEVGAVTEPELAASEDAALHEASRASSLEPTGMSRNSFFAVSQQLLRTVADEGDNDEDDNENNENNGKDDNNNSNSNQKND